METLLIDARKAIPIVRRIGFRAWLLHIAEGRGLVVSEGAPFEGGEAVPGRINQSRWIADCSNCGGAELLDLSDPVFYCLSCGNEAAKGRLLPIVLPDNLPEIETELLRRAPANRNWTMTESLDDLMLENREHGLGDL